MLQRHVSYAAATMLAALLFLPSAAAPAEPSAPALKTRNVVLIVSDGVRWQEVFTGADPTLLNEKDGGIWDSEESLKKAYWRDDVKERRKALFPFLWGTVAVQGQIFGNQALGSIARVTNPYAFSYPGYNEMLTGHADKRIDSNEFGPNPNVNVYEWLNTLADLKGQVHVFATWDTFKDIFNVKRSHLPLTVGWDTPYPGATGAREQLLNQLYATTTRLEDEDVYDAFLQVALIDSFKTSRPRVLFVGYGETDNWAHAGRYDLVLHSAHMFDQFVEQLWKTLQQLPEYRGSTTFIITTDHGRGSGPVDWKEHGVDQKGSDNIWIAVMGPDTAPLGERARTAEVHQAQIAATIAALLGKDYRKAVPEAAPAIAGVVGRQAVPPASAGR
jgi:hypothetical protein